MVPALIIGRKGSTGLPGKNLYPINGKPLAYYPMMAAKKAKHVTDVYLSTDDEKLMEIAESLKINLIKRPTNLATSAALGEHVFVHGYKEIKKMNPEKEIEGVVLLFCNSPTVTSKIIDEGIEALRKHENIDSAVTVSRYNMWSPLRARKEDKDGLLKPFIPLELFEKVFGDTADKLNCDRDSQGDVWFADMGASIVRPHCLEHLDKGLLPQKWMGQNIYPLKQDAGFDVDYEWQIPIVEYWIKKYW